MGEDEGRLDHEEGTRRRVENSPFRYFTLRKIRSSGDRGSSNNSLSREEQVHMKHEGAGPAFDN